MNISENLAFEIIGRREVALHVARAQITDLASRVQRAEAEVQRLRDEASSKECGGDCCKPEADADGAFEPATND